MDKEQQMISDYRGWYVIHINSGQEENPLIKLAEMTRWLNINQIYEYYHTGYRFFFKTESDAAQFVMGWV